MTESRSDKTRQSELSEVRIPVGVDLEEQLNVAQRAVDRLEAENRELRERLQREHPDTDQLVVSPSPRAADDLTRTEKIALFRSLFRGRDDVYALRWDAADGRKGYAPALRPGVWRKKGDPADPVDYLSLGDDAVKAHLEGRLTLGVYPLLRDESTWFLAIDFDKSGWSDDVLAVVHSCHSLGVPAAIERSRSGEGAHLWIFFRQPLPAVMARTLGCVILTHAMDNRHQIRFTSYDRMFPNQDTLPKGGLGNLIALPLQGRVRAMGNTVFLGEDLVPDPDQWGYLSGLRRMESSDVEGVIRAAARRGAVMGVGADWFEMDDRDGRPWEVPPSGRQPKLTMSVGLPTSVEIVLAQRAFIASAGLPSALVAQLRRLASFQNPEFYLAQRMRMSTYGKPRIISCAEDFPEHIGLPRGCAESARTLLESLGIEVIVVDRRQSGAPIAVSFHGELTAEQTTAARVVLRADFGVLSAPTAFGKTVLGAWVIAERSMSVLVLVHRRHLLDQWRESLAFFLDMPIQDIGQIGGGRRRATGLIDVALLPSLTRKGEVDDIVAGYGQVIVDECHHIPAFSFERVLAEARARYVLGLTATPVRKDGHHPIIMMQCGPVRHRIDPRKQAASRGFDHVVFRRDTAFTLSQDGPVPGIQQLFALVSADVPRTRQIIEDVVAAVKDGRSPLVLTERTEHLAAIVEALDGQADHVVVLQGGMGIRQRRAVAEHLTSIPDSDSRIIVATGRYAGEGFDDHRLDTLFLAMPVAWRGTIQQYAGRLHRSHRDKRIVQIYDYVDGHVPVFERMFDKRLLGYGAIGYRVAKG